MRIFVKLYGGVGLIKAYYRLTATHNFRTGNHMGQLAT